MSANNDPMLKLRNGNTQPVPVYQSKFHKTGQAINPQNVNYFSGPAEKVGSSYQPYYSDGGNGQAPIPPQPLINALLSPRNNMFDPNNNLNNNRNSR